ncbi:MAG: hypothetical protein GX600_10735 [Dehalococcoidia bacterium]|nr:hypothetical protein [Dehalococcoidia bacterium]
MVLMEARVTDATHLELSKPIPVERGRKVFVAVAESTEQVAERSHWLEGTIAGLHAAYGDTEPEYTPAMLRESNPDYGT